MTEDEAKLELEKGNYVVEEPGKGFLRVVAAPKPIDIVEIDAIRTLADADQVVIACGGGGIPVIEQQHALKGASAVIEKDSIAARLASMMKVDQLIIYTDVPYVYKNYNTASQEPITNMTISEAKAFIEQDQFGAGTMLPKIEAAIEYLTAVPTGSVLITSLDNTNDAIRGKVGTVITA